MGMHWDRAPPLFPRLPCNLAGQDASAGLAGRHRASLNAAPQIGDDRLAMTRQLAYVCLLKLQLDSCGFRAPTCRADAFEGTAIG